MIRIYLHYLPFLLLLTLAFTLPDPLQAQENDLVFDEEPANQESTDKVIRRVRFTGNHSIPNYTLQTLVRTRTNREFLGINRFTPWYFTWQLFGVGEPPRLLDREVVSNDIERIRLYYDNLGFFETTVDTTIIEFRPGRVEVSFLIDEGPRSHIESVAYTGLPDFGDPAIRDRFFRNSVYSTTMPDDSTFAYSGSYSVQELRAEQTRIIDYLKDYGYASVLRDSVRALVKPREENPQELDILFAIRPGGIYSFGDVYIDLSGPPETGDARDSTIAEGEPYTYPGFAIYMSKERSAQSKFDLLTDQLQFTPGETFNQTAYLQTIRSFQSLGNMTIGRFGLSESSSLPDYSNEYIPVYLDLQTLPRHSIRTEFFGMRRYGFGTGFGVNYTNNNLMGRAESLTLGVNTNFEFVPSNTLREISPRDDSGRRTSSGATIFQSYEVRAEYAVPRLNFPFRTLTEYPWVENGRTRYTLTYSQSDQLFFDINTDIRFNLRYELRHSPRFTSLVDLLELDIVDTDPSDQFLQNLIDEFGEGSFELLRIQQDFNPQFSSLVRYIFRSQNTHLVRRNYGHFSELSVAFGGTIPYLIDRFLVTPGTLEGELPSPFGISSNSLSYSRFIKFSADYRRYVPITPNTLFSFRLFGGFAHPIGDSETIPLNRRFFGGGSNDIRGWNPFRLGPGSISPDEVTVPGGEIKLALFKEFRQSILSDFIGANWQFAWHTDAGNLWYGPKTSFRDEDNVELLRDGKFFFDTFYKQIAVGSGIGLRLDWEFIVLRTDLTFRVHDLELGWFENRQAYFSFGIGHSF